MNNASLLVLIAILPIIAILLYTYKKDKEKEPLKLLLELFILGIISGLLTILMINILDGLFLPIYDGIIKKDIISVAIYSFVKVAFIEEILKWVMIYLFGYKNTEFDEMFDIVVYSIFVSLGFAFLENIYSIFNNASLKDIIIRAILPVPQHAADAVYMGYYLGMAKQARLGKNYIKEKKFLVLSILIPTVMHGIYDFCIMSNNTILTISFFIFVIAIYLLSYNKLGELSNNNKSLNKKSKFCNNCGAIIKDGVCTRCNRRQD